MWEAVPPLDFVKLIVYDFQVVKPNSSAFNGNYGLKSGIFLFRLPHCTRKLGRITINSITFITECNKFNLKFIFERIIDEIKFLCARAVRKLKIYITHVLLPSNPDFHAPFMAPRKKLRRRNKVIASNSPIPSFGGLSSHLIDYVGWVPGRMMKRS